MEEDDLKGKTEEELESLMQSIASGQSVPPEPPPTEVTPEPEPTPTPAPTPKPTEPVEPEPTEPSEAELEAKEQRLALEELQARIKHLESVNGRLAGEVGFLRNRSDRPVAQPSQDEYVEPEPTAPRPKQNDDFNVWVMQDAINKAGAAFRAAHPDLDELKDEIPKFTNGLEEQITQILSMNSPIEAYRQATNVIEAAYYRAKVERKAQERIEFEKQKTERKADQTRKLSEAKAKAAISGSGSSATPPPRAKELSEMTLAELEGLMAQPKR